MSSVQPADSIVSRAPAFESRPLPHPDEPVFDQGLAFDVETLLTRRQVLRSLGYGAMGAGLFTIIACSPAASGSAVPARAARRPPPGWTPARSSPRRPRVHFRVTAATARTC